MPDVVGDTSIRPRFSPDRKTFVASDLGAIVSTRPIDCTVDESGVMRDEQQAEGVWLLTGEYTVSNVPGVTRIVVTDAHTDEDPLDLWSATSYTPPPNTTVQTVVVPSGAGEGQVLAWVDG